MKIILTSFLNTHYWDENNNKHSIVLEDVNKIVTNIKKYVKHFNTFVLVANDPYAFDDNDIRLEVFKSSFEKSGLSFKENIILDYRISNPKDVIQNADMLILSGGKCPRQMDYFKDIDMKNILDNYNGLVIGISAGSMNLCNTVANFPETTEDVNEPRWIDGLGYYDRIIIPHFDGKTATYQLPITDIDIVNDYILPMSKNNTFIAIPNDSYILIDNGVATFYGDMYKIENGVINKIN